MYGSSITRRLFVAHCVFLAVLTVLVSTAALVDARERSYTVTAERMLSVAVAIADNPLVVTAAQSADPTAALQAYTVSVSANADVDSISIMSPGGVRWTHPDPAKIGQKDPDQAVRAITGAAYTEVTSGAGAPSVRAVVPIVDPEDDVVGIVTACISTNTTQTVLDARLPAILILALTLLLAGTVGFWLLDRFLRRATLGWGAEELARNYLLTDSVLRSVREGLALIDRSGTVVFYNDQAARLLGIPARTGSRNGATAPAVTDLDLPPALTELLQSGRPAQDELYPTPTRVLVVSQTPAQPAPSRGRDRAESMGTVVTVRENPGAPSRG